MFNVSLLESVYHDPDEHSSGWDTSTEPAASAQSIASARKHQPGRLVMSRGFGPPSVYRRGLAPLATQTTPIAEPSPSSTGEPDIPACIPSLASYTGVIRSKSTGSGSLNLKLWQVLAAHEFTGLCEPSAQRKTRRREPAGHAFCSGSIKFLAISDQR